MPLARRLHFLALVLGACAMPADAEPRPAATSEDLLRTGHAELRDAATGQAGAAKRAFAAFQAALEQTPDLPTARAGRGLALLAEALEAPMRDKLALARRGCADLDAAVAAAPEDAAVRLLRAASAVKVPLLLERQSVAETDFALLLTAAHDPRAIMAPETRRGIFYHAAAFALKERRAGAAELLEQAASIPASEPSDEQIQSLLALARRQNSPLNHADSHPPEKATASRP